MSKRTPTPAPATVGSLTVHLTLNLPANLDSLTLRLTVNAAEPAPAIAGYVYVPLDENGKLMLPGREVTP